MRQSNDLADLLMKSLPVEAGLTKDAILALIEKPKDSQHGDLAFPVFVLAKQLRKAPPVIASELAEKITPAVEASESFSTVKAVGPYLNFFLDKEAFAGEILTAVLDGSFLARRREQSERVMVEYSQPNTHKAFHVGHIRCAALGDSVTRILEWSGYQVVPVNYIGDEGTHVAKCLWYFLCNPGLKVPEENRGEFLGEMYVKATELLDLATYTKVPLPGILTAKVVAVEPHPKNKEWSVVEVNLGSRAVKVVCGQRDLAPNSIVAYAAPGTRVAGRGVETIDKDGVSSEGMICSVEELGLGEGDKSIYLFAPDTAPGQQIAELFKTEAGIKLNLSVLEHVAGLESEVSQILQRVEDGDPEIKALWEETREWSMQDFYKVYAWLNCRFDHYFTESECREPSKEIVREYQKIGIFVEDDGAVGADLREFGLGFCLLIKRDGTALYATRDLYLARIKFEKYKIDHSLYVVDAGQRLHFQQVFKCLELMGFEQAKSCKHLDYAQVVRPDGKMSSRKGNVILFSELRSLLLSKIIAEFLDKYRGEWSDQEIDSAAYAIALATIRYGMMNQDNNSVIVFDLDEWASRSGNTGPYMLYAYARMRSIIRDAGEHELLGSDWSLLVADPEVDLIRHLGEFHQTVERAAANLAPSVICSYVYELARCFNRMYKDCPVLKAESEELKLARLALVESTSRVLKQGLALLGVGTIERM